MSSIVRKIQGGSRCLDFSKPDLQKAAKSLRVSAEGQKADLCKYITKALKASKKKKSSRKPSKPSRASKRASKPSKKSKKSIKRKSSAKKGFSKQKDWSKFKRKSSIKKDFSKDYYEFVVPNSIHYEANKTKTFYNNFKVINEISSQVLKYGQLIPFCARAKDAHDNPFTFPISDKEFKVIADDMVDPAVLLNPSKDSKDQMYLWCFMQQVFANAESSKYKDSANTLKWLTKDINKFFAIKKLSTGSNGVTWLVYHKSKTNKVVEPPFSIMKAVNSNSSTATTEGELVHELAVGYVLNLLRREIPNFTFTYGGFWCDLQQSGSSLSCTTYVAKKSTTLTMQEAILNSQSLEDWWMEAWKRNPSRSQLAQDLEHILLQTAHALYKAEAAFKYVHLDLHWGNVLIRKLKSTTNISLKTNKYNIVLTNVRYVPMIIDYGMNALVYEGTFLGNTWRYNVADIDTDEVTMNELGYSSQYYYNPGFDMYRLLINLILKTERKGNTMLKSINNEMFSRWMNLYNKEANKLSSTNKRDSYFKEFLQSGTVQQFYKDFQDNYRYVCARWRAAFQKDSGDWIRAYLAS